MLYISHLVPRSIPAHAGEPASRTKSSDRAEGLSPRMRGNPSMLGGVVFDQGSIPAHAGEPAQSRPASGIQKVYPRACGGTISLLLFFLFFLGLSPRMRGNPDLRPTCLRPTGSIPAHAGEPTPITCTRLSTWVYPRACGGTRRSEARPGLSGGLSPRMRGNPRTTRLSPPGPRSIPAHAGEPTT